MRRLVSRRRTRTTTTRGHLRTNKKNGGAPPLLFGLPRLIDMRRGMNGLLSQLNIDASPNIEKQICEVFIRGLVEFKCGSLFPYLTKFFGDRFQKGVEELVGNSHNEQSGLLIKNEAEQHCLTRLLAEVINQKQESNMVPAALQTWTNVNEQILQLNKNTDNMPEPMKKQIENIITTMKTFNQEELISNVMKSIQISAEKKLKQMTEHNMTILHHVITRIKSFSTQSLQEGPTMDSTSPEMSTQAYILSVCPSARQYEKIQQFCTATGLSIILKISPFLLSKYINETCDQIEKSPQTTFNDSLAMLMNTIGDKNGSDDQNVGDEYDVDEFNDESDDKDNTSIKNMLSQNKFRLVCFSLLAIHKFLHGKIGSKLMRYGTVVYMFIIFLFCLPFIYILWKIINLQFSVSREITLLQKGQQQTTQFGQSYFYSVKWRVYDATCRNMV